MNSIVMKGIEKMLSSQASESDQIIVEEEEEEEKDEEDIVYKPQVKTSFFNQPLEKEPAKMEVTDADEIVVEEEVEEEATSMNRVTTEDQNVDMRKKMEQTNVIQRGNVISNPKNTTMS
mmetsp:Transcript_9427/g.8941  ORF Transcript_9427/g.8941 Transcript_9427/m.8941 type:complete len:119 (+) Transcript_9427:797-1153(+)